MEYLFDRLSSGGAKGDAFPGSAGGAVEAAVTRELERITSQRQYFEGFEYRRDTSDVPNVLAFGISRGIGEVLLPQAANALAIEIKRSILAHEPRLLRPTVSIRGIEKGGSALVLMIQGYLKVDEQMIHYKRQFSALGGS